MTAMRHICYITGTRADFGLMQKTLMAIQQHPELRLSILATGMHLSATYGNTIEAIRHAGLPVSGEVPVDLSDTTGAAMARNIATMLTGFVGLLERMRPDIVLLLGDRGEMLAGVLAAIHLNIPVAHIHGGERSGTVDEPVRHAISKLSHFHFAATEDSKRRLVSMGECADHVFVTGAPGLDGLESMATTSRQDLVNSAGLNAAGKVALLVYHPVLQETTSAGSDVKRILDALLRTGCQVMALMPNADAGSSQIRTMLEARMQQDGVRGATHFPRDKFVSWMANADLMIGNSSAGIIEAASFGTPVINIGNRQRLRERNSNVIDAQMDDSEIEAAIVQAFGTGRFACKNIYGDGKSAGRIVELLRGLSLDPSLLMKANAY